MKSDNFDLKRVFAIFSFILVFILIAAFVFVYLNPKNEAKDESSQDSYTDSVAIDFSDVSHPVADIRRQNEEKVLAGKITSYNSKTLAEWFCSNLLNEYGTLSDISEIFISKLATFNEFSIYHALCKTSFASGNEIHHYYVNIIMGAKNENLSYYYLIDGVLTEHPSMRFNLENSWDKIQSHAVFGKYAGEFPQEVRSEGMKELPLFKYIGEDKVIFDSLWVSDDVIAILSADFSLQNKGYYIDWKVDFINLNYPEQTVSHPLAIENKEQLFYHNCSKDEDYITLYFDFSKSGIYEKLEYKVKIGTADTDEDIINILDNFEDELYLYSESGRYYVFVNEEDLYLHDTVNDQDILVFKASEDENIYTFADPAFFVGDTLYYNVYQFESNASIGSYNPDTKVKKLYKNGIEAQFYADGYIYGSSYEIEGAKRGLKRFSLKNPDKVEHLLYYEDSHYTNIFPSPDEKYIIKINTPFDNKSQDSAVTVYDATDFKEQKNLYPLVPVFDLQ